MGNFTETKNLSFNFDFYNIFHAANVAFLYSQKKYSIFSGGIEKVT